MRSTFTIHCFILSGIRLKREGRDFIFSLNLSLGGFKLGMQGNKNKTVGPGLQMAVSSHFLTREKI
jgi:hypothetical protein